MRRRRLTQQRFEVRYLKRTECGPVLALLVAPATAEQAPSEAHRPLGWTRKGRPFRGESSSKTAQPQIAPPTQSPFLESAFYSSELGLMFTLFPLDRRLRALAQLCSLRQRWPADSASNRLSFRLRSDPSSQNASASCATR